MTVGRDDAQAGLDDGAREALALKRQFATFGMATPTPAETNPLLTAGRAHAQAERFSEAAEALAQCILQDPQSAEAHDELAVVLLRMGQLAFATKAKAKAVGLGRNGPEDWQVLGEMFSALGQPDDALRAFGTALSLRPGWPEVEAKVRALFAESEDVRGPQEDMPSEPVGTVHSQPLQPEAASGGAVSRPVLPEVWRNISIVMIEPEGYAHVAAFQDLADSFVQALGTLGAEVRLRTNSMATEGVNILFGAHLIAGDGMTGRIPPNTVLVNLEQLRGFDVGNRPTYAGLLQRMAVWDYSARNVAHIRRLTGNANVFLFGIGYAPVLTRRLPAVPQTVDVLFYGSLNARRKAILTSLERAGLKVKHLFNVYGEARDAAISEAKIVLNLHFYEDSIHEIVRTSYLLANRKAVVSECGPETEIDADVKDAMLAAPYADIVDACVALLRDEPRRLMMEQRGFNMFAKRNQADMLLAAILETRFPLR